MADIPLLEVFENSLAAIILMTIIPMGSAAL